MPEQQEWAQSEQKAFETLRTALCDETVMAHPRLNELFRLYTDACQNALGGILCQIDKDGIDRPIRYVSACFTGSQRN